MGLESFVGYNLEIKFINPKDILCLRDRKSALKIPQNITGRIDSLSHMKKTLYDNSPYIEIISINQDSQTKLFKKEHFQVGDLLIGNEINFYDYTNEESIMRVMSDLGDLNIGRAIHVEIICSRNRKIIGDHFTVDPLFFRKAVSEDLAKFDKKEI